LDLYIVNTEFKELTDIIEVEDFYIVRSKDEVEAKLKELGVIKEEGSFGEKIHSGN